MLRARDLMTEDVLTIPSSASVAEAIVLMQAEKVRSLLAIDTETPQEYGMLTERDIVYRVIAPGTDPAEVSVSTIMRQPCISIQPDHTIQDVAQLFAYSGIQRAPVMNNETLLGIISVTDIIMKLDMGSQMPEDTLSHRIQEVLLHTRVSSNPEEQIAKETAIAWNLVEELEE